ncbi:MAG: ABC-type transport auxiliary lipoprotein family protein [Sphingopyxis sp.]
MKRPADDAPAYIAPPPPYPPHRIYPMRLNSPLCRAPVAMLAFLALPACISLGPKAPDMLLTLSAASAPVASADARTGTAAAALTIIAPTTPAKLRTPRVPVQTGATTIAYVQDAQWVEAPARLFQRLLSETIAAQGTRMILDDSQYAPPTGEVLTGQLLDFGVNADSMQVVVVFQAERISGDAVAQRRFESREPISAVEPALIGAALNRAANRVAADVSQWVAR